MATNSQELSDGEPGRKTVGYYVKEVYKARKAFQAWFDAPANKAAADALPDAAKQLLANARKAVSEVDKAQRREDDARAKRDSLV